MQNWGLKILTKNSRPEAAKSKGQHGFAEASVETEPLGPSADAPPAWSDEPLLPEGLPTGLSMLLPPVVSE